MMKKFLCIIFVNLLTCYSMYGAVHTVTNTNDSGLGSLRQAILDANGDVGPTRTINFSIGTGVQTIKPLTQLPLITVSNTLIDGTTQPGWSVGSPVIVVNGSLLPPPGVATGIITISAVDNCVIQGLVINGGNNSNAQFGILITDNGGTGANNNAVYGCFVGTDTSGTVAVPNHNGIRINAFTPTTSNNNIIGGANLGQANLISGNANGGIQMLKNVNNTVIQGNLIGTDKTGAMALPNLGFGVASFGSLTPLPLPQEQNVGTLIGGSVPGEGNVISGNANAGNGVGIVLWFDSFNTVIQGNFIGVNKAGTGALPNDYGIFCFGTNSPNFATVSGTLIGGPNFGEANVISGNNFQGILFQNNIMNNTIQGNFIGTDVSGTMNLGNGATGILVQGDLNQSCTNNLIGGTGVGQGNVILFNGNADAPDYGVWIDGNITTPDDRNPILRNSIFANNNNGIRLQNSTTIQLPPIIIDRLNRGNNLQQPPTIISATFCDGILTIHATAPSNPPASNFRLEFFVNDINRNPITEGQRFAGVVTPVTSGSNILNSFIVPGIVPGSWVSGTATNLNNPGGTPGDTSEFSTNVQILQTFITLSANPSVICLGESSLLSAFVTGTPPFTVAWSDGFIQLSGSSPVTRTVSPASTTSYFATLTDASSCISISAPIIVRVASSSCVFCNP